MQMAAGFVRAKTNQECVSLLGGAQCSFLPNAYILLQTHLLKAGTFNWTSYSERRGGKSQGLCWVVLGDSSPGQVSRKQQGLPSGVQSVLQQVLMAITGG